MVILAPTHRDQFERDGYLLVEDILDPDGIVLNISERSDKWQVL